MIMAPIQIETGKAFSYYPSSDEIDSFAENLYHQSTKVSYQVRRSDHNPICQAFGNGPNALQNHYYCFTMPDGHQFCAYWQPAMKSPAPLLINLPGYGGYISMHPQISDDGYHILHISPLGYVMPKGPNLAAAMEDGNWPVLHNTAMGLPGGYQDWLLDCLVAIRWAVEREDVLSDRVSLYGTSQGGGGSLLLASILQDKIRCVCADLPFLTAFPMTGLEGDAYGILRKAYAQMAPADFWHNLGYFDTVSHSHRLTMPVMLSGGGQDIVCPPETVEYLFQRLPGTRQYSFLAQNVHTHSRQSIVLFRSWLNMFA